ncbi:hypothetical protein [Azotobacter armeniacus]
MLEAARCTASLINAHLYEMAKLPGMASKLCDSLDEALKKNRKICL